MIEKPRSHFNHFLMVIFERVSNINEVGPSPDWAGLGTDNNDDRPWGAGVKSQLIPEVTPRYFVTGSL